MNKVSRGDKHYRLTVSRVISGDRGRLLICVCECGGQTIVAPYDLVSGNTKSCGCLNTEARKDRWTTHGLSGTKEFNAKREADRIANLKSTSKEEHKARVNKNNAAYKSRNREIVRAKNRAYKKANPDITLANTRDRQARQMNASPVWADKAAILEIYKRAADIRKKKMDVEVDHIYPLRGESVCGLHVHWNLRIVPARINRLKGNRV